MASKTVYQDDLDGSINDDVKPVTFSLAGKSYTIDLGPASMKKLETALKPFISKATAVTGTKSKVPKSTATKSDPAYLSDVRKWAAKNGHKVSSRGRISAVVLEAYAKANK